MFNMRLAFKIKRYRLIFICSQATGYSARQCFVCKGRTGKNARQISRCALGSSRCAFASDLGRFRRGLSGSLIHLLQMQQAAKRVF